MLAAVVSLSGVPSSAWSDAPTQPDKRPWNVDFFQGPLVNSQRMVGLGGAFVGIADGLEGHLSNPAAFAVRAPFFGNDWFDWDLGTSAYTVVGDIDYDLSGRVGGLDSATSQQVGFNLKFGHFGIGTHVLSQQFRLTTTDATGAEQDFSWSQSFGGIGMAWAFRDGELVIGTLLGVGQARIGSASSGEVVDYASPVYPTSFGLLFAPRGLPYRVGMAWRLPLLMTQDNAETYGGERVAKVAEREVPDSVRMGGQFELGTSWMLGPRIYNIRPSYGVEPLPVGSRDIKQIRRKYVLLSAALSITGPVQDGVGVAAYLDGERQESGQTTVVSLRAGAESEVMENRLVVRGGTYLEPSRFGRDSRGHLTMGADVRLQAWWQWRITIATDLASKYSNTAIGLGFWH